MTDTPEPRRPQAFAADDPSLVSEPLPEVDAPPDAAAGVAAPDASLARPTLADLGERGLRWGTLLVAALAGAALLGAGAWFARLVSAALLRDDWLGWTTLALLGVAALAAVMLLLREIIGFSRLARLHRLKTDATASPARPRPAAASARPRAASPTSMPAGRRCALAVRRFRQYTRDVHDPGELLVLADRDIVAVLDTEARGLITRSAKRVATVTAMSPMVFISVGYVLSRTCACCAASPRCTAAGRACSARCALPAWCSATSSPPAASP